MCLYAYVGEWILVVLTYKFNTSVLCKADGTRDPQIPYNFTYFMVMKDLRNSLEYVSHKRP